MRRILSILFLLALVAGAFAAYKTFGPNTGNLSRGEYLYIRTGSTYQDVKQALSEGGYVSDIWSFDMLAGYAKYPAHVHPGKYKIEPGMSNYNMLRMLRNGRQTPVKLVINKLRTKKDFSSLVGKHLEADSTVILQMLNDPAFAANYDLDTNTIMCAVMQDTYDFYWNTRADTAFKKIAKNYRRFWTEERKQEAKDQGLSQVQAITLASIIDEESNKNDEKPNIASTYLNRLHKGMALQADPTVKFAIGDFTIRRITGVHLEVNSPYNTYTNTGLPPGPICTPSVSSIEAVLKAPQTNYLYFCAKPDFSGYHNFAAGYEEQMKNAHLYQQALNEKGIH